jgi:hypothetical protein
VGGEYVGGRDSVGTGWGRLGGGEDWGKRMSGAQREVGRENNGLYHRREGN